MTSILNRTLPMVKKGQRSLNTKDFNRHRMIANKIASSLPMNGLIDSTGLHTRRQAVGGISKDGTIRRARTRAAAGAGATIACNLFEVNGTTEITSGDESNITVNCEICGGSALNAAVPRLANNDEIAVYKQGGSWYCTTVFQTSQDCE